MKLSDQLNIQSQALSTQAHSQGVNALKVSGKAQEITGDSKVENALTNAREQLSEYPMASDEEVHVRDKRKAFNGFKKTAKADTNADAKATRQTNPKARTLK